jgi:hypothetical protein
MWRIALFPGISGRCEFIDFPILPPARETGSERIAVTVVGTMSGVTWRSPIDARANKTLQRHGSRLALHYSRKVCKLPIMMTFGFVEQTASVTSSAAQHAYIGQASIAALGDTVVISHRATAAPAKHLNLTGWMKPLTGRRTHPVLNAVGSAPCVSAEKAPGPIRREPMTYPMMPAHRPPAAAR